MYFVRIFPLGRPTSPFAHSASHVFPGCLTWSVASSCTRGDEDFLRKTANYISEMHAVWSTLDEIARVRRAGYVEPPRLDLASVSFRLSRIITYTRSDGTCDSARRGTPRRQSTRVRSPGTMRPARSWAPLAVAALAATALLLRPIHAEGKRRVLVTTFDPIEVPVEPKLFAFSRIRENLDRRCDFLYRLRKKKKKIVY